MEVFRGFQHEQGMVEGLAHQGTDRSEMRTDRSEGLADYEMHKDPQFLDLPSLLIPETH